MRTLVAMDHSEEARAPRLLAATGPLLLSPLGWVMDAIADAGYSGVEVLLAMNPETREPDTVLTYARNAGLDVPVMHGPYMLLLRNVLGSDYIDKSRRSLQIAAEVGARTLVAHAPLRWERLARGWIAAEADAEAADLGVAFAMENLFPVRGFSLSCVITPEQLAPFTHVVFDTSHFAIAGVDLFEAWEALSDQVVHLHVSDNLGTGTDSHAPIGAGVLPLEQFLAHVGASGWSGTITLELDCRAHLDSREALVSFLARERVKAERLLAGDLESAPTP